ncbi:hypothetical protein D1872_278990 [compost metagenome]
MATYTRPCKHPRGEITHRSCHNQLLARASQGYIQHPNLLGKQFKLQAAPNRQMGQCRIAYAHLLCYIFRTKPQLFMHQEWHVQILPIEHLCCSCHKDNRELQPFTLVNRHDAYSLICIRLRSDCTQITAMLTQSVQEGEEPEQPSIRCGLLI